MALTTEKLAGVYELHTVKETASAFKLNASGSFQFFFSYGALDRHGSGTWILNDKMILMQSRPWPGTDFELVASETSGRGITLKVTDPNPVFQKRIFASLKNGEQGSWKAPDAKGEMFFDVNEAETITLAFEFIPERMTFLPIPNKEHNYFEFRLAPWALEVFFKDFSLKANRYMLIGKHPLLTGEQFAYEKA